MLITAIQIEDYKRVRKVAITPAADAHLILLGGKNMQGKSSTLDALTAAFGGGKTVAADPVRHGAKEASIFVELDGGKLTIDRVVAPDGKTTLEVRNEDGPVRSPQAMLDKLVGSRALDPLAFLRLPAKEQRAQLMKVIPEAERLEVLEKKKDGAFDRRTEIGRELVKAEGEFARLENIDEIGTPIDVAALSAELGPLTDAERRFTAAAATVSDAMRATSDKIGSRDRDAARAAEIDAQIAKLMAEVSELRALEGGRATLIAELVEKERQARANLESARAEREKADQRRGEIARELARANEHNATVHERAGAVKRREEAAAAIAKLKTDRDTMTAMLKTIETRKAEILAKAKLPVEGLEVDANGILLSGVPFEQASGAEKLRVALAIAASASPGLDDVWVKDAAILDDESITIVAEWAAKAGKRCWLEVVGTRDPGVIEIRDGQVANAG